MQFVWRPVRNFIFDKILHADDTPHRLALGVAIGIFVASTPTVGLHTVLVVVLAALLRANKIVGLPVVWIVNPVTLVPFYYSCWWLGAELMPGSGTSGESVRQQLRSLTAGHGSLFQDMLHLEFWTGIMRVMLSLGAELWVGCLVVGIVGGVLSYFLTRTLVVAYRVRHARHKMAAYDRSADKPAHASSLPPSREAVQRNGIRAVLRGHARTGHGPRR